MAFDLYVGSKREAIAPHEEGLFELVQGREDYPTLNWLWERYYDSPTISTQQANLLVHELIRLLATLPERPDLRPVRKVILRLLPFFSEAVVSNVSVGSSSD